MNVAFGLIPRKSSASTFLLTKKARNVDPAAVRVMGNFIISSATIAVISQRPLGAA